MGSAETSGYALAGRMPPRGALPHGLPWIDLDIQQRFLLVRMTAGALVLRVDVDRKSPRRISRERKLGGRARFDALLDVIAMKMQNQRPIRCPPHPYDVALFDADEPHRIGDATMLHVEIECELSGRRAEERAAR